MAVLSPIVVLNSLSGISGQQYFTATDQISILLKAYVSAAVLNMVVNALLIPRYGCIGAAVATVGSSLISTIIQYYYLTKQINVSELVLYAVKYGLASTAMAVFIFFMSRRLPAAVYTTALQFVLGLAFYSAVMLLIKDPAIRELIKKAKRILKRRAD